MNLVAPRLAFDGDAELRCEGLKRPAIDVPVHDASWRRVPSVFGKMDVRRATSHERVGGETRSEAMHTFEHEPEARIPLRSLVGVLDPEDRYQLVGPVTHI